VPKSESKPAEQLAEDLRADIGGLLSYVTVLENMGGLWNRQAIQQLFILVVKLINTANHSQALVISHERRITELERNVEAALQANLKALQVINKAREEGKL